MEHFILYAYLGVAFLIAGTVKGTVGIGLPMTAVALMTLTLDARTAISLILIPMLLTNAWQVHRTGHTLRTARRYLPFAIMLVIGVAITLTLTRNVSDRVLLGLLGLSILVFVAVNASKWKPNIPARHDRSAQFIAGAISGVMGGLTSVWAPPMAVYLAARQVGKDEFVRASGLLIFIGCIPLVAGYLRQGYLTAPLAATSVALLIPTFAGFALGERLRRRMSEKAFKTILLLVFSVMALNLIRRAIM